MLKEVNEIIERKKRDEIKAGFVVVLDENCDNAPDFFSKLICGVSNEAAISNINFGIMVLNRLNGEIYDKIMGAADKFYPSIRVQRFQTGENGDVLLIDPAPESYPVSYYGHFYGIQNNKAIPLSFEKFDVLRYNSLKYDWSAQINNDSTLDDLDIFALRKARNCFKSRHLHLERELEAWSDKEFLENIALMQNGKLTNTALLLLGKEGKEHFLQPVFPQISWIKKDDDGMEKGYQHFNIPFLMKVEELLTKVNNMKYGYSLETEDAPVETTRYESKVLSEAIINSISHNDYKLDGQIIIEEFPTKITLINRGALEKDTIKNIILGEKPLKRVKNNLLIRTLVKLNLMDDISGGLKRMINIQRIRNFPLPDFEISGLSSVKTTIYGKMINKNYTEKLAANKEISLYEVYLLDRVQKSFVISEKEYEILKDKKLVTGKYPDVSVASKYVAKEPETVTAAPVKKFWTNEEIRQLVLDYLEKRKEAGRQEIDDLIIDKYSKELSEEKRRNKVKNLLYQLSRVEQVIKNVGSATKPVWMLNK